jgi:hypothetical protein
MVRKDYRMRKTIIVIIVVFWAFLTGNAFAALITFTHSGSNASGTLDGTPFSNASFTITAQGDTDNIQTGSVGELYIDHTSASITIGSSTVNFITPTRTWVGNVAERVGFARAGSSGLNLFDGGLNDIYETWDMTTSIGPASGIGSQLAQWDTPTSVQTDGGILFFTPLSPVPGNSFEANVVPIPGAVWLLGSGLIGLVALRKKFKK